MKRLFILLVFILTASALCAQRPTARQKNTPPKSVSGARNAKQPTSGGRVAFQKAAADSTATQVADQVQQAIDTVPAGSSAIKASSAPCEEAPTVTFDGNTFELDCESIATGDGHIHNKYIVPATRHTLPEIKLEWDPNWLTNQVYGDKTNRDGVIQLVRKHWEDSSRDIELKINSLDNGQNRIISCFTFVGYYNTLEIFRTFDQGNIRFSLFIPREIRNDKAKLDEWRSQMETEAVDWLIPTPYK
ncbi:MAG: hypothetical protein MJ053_02220 [Elusimicrobiaceae bacterium]|nr:hypothetical protein [Elusimicrobiaceae bacterium]